MVVSAPSKPSRGSLPAIFSTSTPSSGFCSSPACNAAASLARISAENPESVGFFFSANSIAETMVRRSGTVSTGSSVAGKASALILLPALSSRTCCGGTFSAMLGVVVACWVAHPAVSKVIVTGTQNTFNFMKFSGTSWMARTFWVRHGFWAQMIDVSLGIT